MAEIVRQEVEENLLYHAIAIPPHDAEQVLEDYATLLTLVRPELVPLPDAEHAIEADRAIYSVFPTHVGMNRRMMERQRQSFCTRLRATWKTSGGCWRLFPEGHPCGHVDAHHLRIELTQET